VGRRLTGEAVSDFSAAGDDFQPGGGLPGRHHALEQIGQRHWPAEQVALHARAAMLGQEVRLLSGFDAFGNDAT
jgi:hypothetical protein